MAPIDLEVRKREISALAVEVRALEQDLKRKGIDAADPFDRMEAMDIINRIERRMRSAQPAKVPAQQPTDAYQEAGE